MRQIKHLPRSLVARGNKDQQLLPLAIEQERDVAGIGMGILNDGTPFLTQRGLAELCGVMNAHIGTISRDWNRDPATPRITTIKRLLSERPDVPARIESPHIRLVHAGREVFAYPDYVCVAIIEYYAWEAGTNNQPQALKTFRRLANYSLREMIYRELGYKPAPAIPMAWQQFHDRVTANHEVVPKGYFSIFKELADLIVTMIRNGANFGPEFVPDISVGRKWAEHWVENGLAASFGERRRYAHNYPEYFAQAESNPQAAYCYPNEALAEYRRWMEDVYVRKHLQPYLEGAAKRGVLPPSFTQLVMDALVSPQERKSLS